MHNIRDFVGNIALPIRQYLLRTILISYWILQRVKCSNSNLRLRPKTVEYRIGMQIVFIQFFLPITFKSSKLLTVRNIDSTVKDL